VAASYVIPARVRLAIVHALGPQNPSPAQLAEHVQLEYGFHRLGDLPDAMEATGEAEASQVRNRLQLAAQSLGSEDAAQLRASGPRDPDILAKVALLSVPDAVFASAVDHGLDVYAGYAFDFGMSAQPAWDLRDRIGRLLSRNGVPFGFGEDGRLAPTGSRVMAEATLVPAYDALEDPRMADARRHLIEAVQRLAEPDDDEAVDEARMAVEAGMLALLDARSVPHPAKRQPQDLFDALVDDGALSRNVQEIVLAAPRFRGRTRAGHAGGPAVSDAEAEAAVGAAASALRLIAGALPTV
jgi:hypothetical protein